LSGVLTLGTPPIEVRLKRNARARRLTLRVSQADGRATLTMPKRASLREAKAFVIRQEDWLRRQIARLPARAELLDGAEIPFRGQTLTLRTVAGRSVRVNGTVLEVATPNPAPRLRAFLKLQARNALLPAVERYAGQIGRPFGRITLRDTRSRWGSCTSDGNLMFSWRLVMAPPAVLDYVAAHEVAHLVHMNHSAEFWRIVGDLMPDYADHRHWLRENGAKLHSVDFGA